MPTTATAYPDGVTQDDVQSFCDFCVSLRSTFRHFQILFEEGGDLRRELLNSIAPMFFDDLNHLLIDHLILQICKVTDREESQRRKNLTILFFINNSDFLSAPIELAKLKQLGESMVAFRKKLLPARHKLVGHLDRDSVLEGNALGEAEKSEWEKFWLDLQDFTHILHKRYIDPDGTFYLNAAGPLSDADSLIRAIKRSTYFETLISSPETRRVCANVIRSSKYSDA